MLISRIFDVNFSFRLVFRTIIRCFKYYMKEFLGWIMRKLVIIIFFIISFRSAYHYDANVKSIDFADYTVHDVFLSLFSHIQVFDHVLPPECPYNGTPGVNISVSLWSCYVPFPFSFPSAAFGNNSNDIATLISHECWSGCVDRLSRLAGITVWQLETLMVSTEAAAAAASATTTTYCSLPLVTTTHSGLTSAPRRWTAATWSSTQSPLTTATQVASGLPSWSLPSLTPTGAAVGLQRSARMQYCRFITAWQMCDGTTWPSCEVWQLVPSLVTIVRNTVRPDILHSHQHWGCLLWVS